ncbi:MAG: hypothetical protein JWM86_467 [Thermoleophilia bacterium]|nr:hypothetical protein [Thermoleophilia bacterium]
MCPPPIDPILPLGPVAGGMYVDRTALPGRVTRRRPREEEDPDERRRSGHGDEQQPDGDEPGARWIGSRTPAVDAGAYDDHGRIAHVDADDLPGAPHVDRTA